MLKMKDLLQEGRNIQETFKKRMSINEGSAVITVPVEDSYDQYGEGEYFQELLKKKGIKSTFEQQMSDIELTVDKKDAKKAVAILSNAGYAPTLNVVVGKNVQTVGKTNLPSSAKGGSVILNFYAVGGGAYTKKDEANFAIEVLKKKGITAKLVKVDQFDDQVSLKVSKADAKKAIEVLSDNAIEIEEGRKIQEKFKKNVVTEEITRKYRDEVNKEYIALASKARKIGQFTFEPSKKGPSQWGATTKSGDGDLVVFFKPFSHPETGETQPKFEVSVWNVYPNSQGIESKYGGSSFSNSKYMKPLTPTDDPKKDAKLALDYIKNFLNSPDLARTLKSLR